MSRFRISLALVAAFLCIASLASAAGFTEFEDRPAKDGDNSEDDALAQPAPVPWNLQSFATAFPGRAKLIRGTLDAKDVDAYSFALSSGQLLLAAVFENAGGEKNDTSLGVFTPSGPAVATDDDSGPGFFSRVAFNVATTATHRVVVSGFGDTAFNGTHFEAAGGLVPYTLVVAAVSNPPPQSESESNNTLATANVLNAEAGVVGGSLTANDIDYYRIDLEAGDRIAVSVFDLKTGQFQVAGGERNDAQLGVFSPTGTLAATNDDGGPGFQPNVLFTVPAGQGGSWKVAVTGFGDTGFTGNHKEAFSYLLVVARERACPSVAALLTGAITVSTGKAYVAANLKGGDFYYIDRTNPGAHVLVDIPAAYECSQWIKTANDDKAVSTNPHLSFNVSAPASVFVGFDSRSASEPPWLATGFTPTGEILDVADTDRTQEFRLLRRDFAAGPVALGGNLPSNASSNYVVFVRPLNLTDPLHAFSIPGLPSQIQVQINGVTLNVFRQTGQTAAQLAAAVAAAINANSTLAGLRIFGVASGVTFVTTGTIQSVSANATPIPALPDGWAIALPIALAVLLYLYSRRASTSTPTSTV